MTATSSVAPAVSPARPPAPRPKTVTFDTESPLSTDAASTATASPRRSTRPSTTDPLSDRATSLLIRRTLCSPQLGDKSRDAQVPIDELLPPLTSRNDVDLQLYAILAIVLREFVQSWYNKITTDESFVAEVLHIIAHCSRALEQRFRKVDLETLVLDEIPDLLDKHITSPVPHPDKPDTIPDQAGNEVLYRQLLVQGILAILLPTEDLENPCLTSLVEQIFSELIIGNIIANKASQPWMLYEGICITARVLRQKKDEGPSPAGNQKESPEPKLEVKGRRAWSVRASVRSIFLGVIQLGMVVVASLRFISTALVMASSLPARTTPIDEKEVLLGQDKHSSVSSSHGSSDYVKAPILSCRVWTCLGNLLELSLRMPWLDGLLSLLQYGAVNGPGRIAGHDGPVDRLLSHHINSLFSPSNLPPLLRTLRGVLFPNNAPGKASLFPPSSEAELHALRRRAAKSLWELLPKGVGRLYFGGRLWRRGTKAQGDLSDDEDLVDEMERLLLVLDDEYCNKHLMYSILELVLARLMPELTEKGVTELWEERLG
ncbi:hypothetical protein FSPOR_101 [Fusarium sporotrichioides]|uniref:PXA domain-containing protein n=1 Tax=Fusarium sporotrichioides TaxID=5514 RepID=A0A395SVK7_FUSSP|nr:hypothetical protein FSPOR_101 [Fusarium sporotrichioides]